MSLLSISSGVALAVAIAGFSAGSDRHHHPLRTPTATKPAIATRRQPGALALVSQRGPTAGAYVPKPSKLNLIYGYRSDAAAAHLKWVDWGQPVAFATGDILIQTSSGGFESVPGALVLNELIACGTKPAYYYKSATAYTPTYYKYSSVSVGKPQLASPC
jgi:hypothetical protein